jgi:hypothetical protein
MNPFPLESRWQVFRNRVAAPVAVIICSLIVAQPSSLLGAAMTLITVTPLLFVFSFFSYQWGRYFGGSKVLTVVFYLLIFSAVWTINDLIIPVLEPYIGKYFSE